MPAAEIEALVMAALRNRLSGGIGPLPDDRELAERHVERVTLVLAYVPCERFGTIKAHRRDRLRGWGDRTRSAPGDRQGVVGESPQLSYMRILPRALRCSAAR